MREKDVNLPCRIFAILVMLFLLAPLVVIVIASFTPTALITFPPQGFSLKWYANIFGSSTHFMDGLVNSLKIGILNARNYVEYVERAIGCHIGYVSVGAERDSLIIR